MEKIHSVIEKILEKKRQEIEERKKIGLCFKPFEKRAPFDFAFYLRRKGFIIIAEIKRGSPSKGLMLQDFLLEEIVRDYEEGGAGAISVLTDREFFWGSLEYLARTRELTSLPLLRKDFILDKIQIEEAKAFGADIVLLIATFLEKETLKKLNLFAREIGLSTLVEIHDEKDLEKALYAEAEVIGINNRDLKTLKVDTRHALKIKKLVPKEIPVVAESGYSGEEDLLMLKKEGFAGVLIGTALSLAKNRKDLLISFSRRISESF